MARITGRNGALYADASAGASGSASKVAFMKHYTINGTRDKTDVTAFGDGTKVYIAGHADASGTADGHSQGRCELSGKHGPEPATGA